MKKRGNRLPLLFIFVVMSLIFLLQLCLYATVAASEQQSLRGVDRRLQFDPDEQNAEGHNSVVLCQPDEVLVASKDGITICEPIKTTTTGSNTSTASNATISNYTGTDPDTCLDLELTADSGLDSSNTTDSNCFNLTIFGWSEEDLGPWDPWAGFVCVDMPHSEVLQVTYEPVTYWKLWETSLWVGTNLTELATNASTGQADWVQFPYRNATHNGTDSVTYTVELDSQSACDQGDSYALHVVSHAFVAEPMGKDPSTYIWKTEYQAWGQDINNMPVEQEGSNFLYFDLPISCRCSGLL